MYHIGQIRQAGIVATVGKERKGMRHDNYEIIMSKPQLPIVADIDI